MKKCLLTLLAAIIMTGSALWEAVPGTGGEGGDNGWQILRPFDDDDGIETTRRD